MHNKYVSAINGYGDVKSRAIRNVKYSGHKRSTAMYSVNIPINGHHYRSFAFSRDLLHRV